MIENIEMIASAITALITLITIIAVLIAKYAKSERARKFADTMLFVRDQVTMYTERAEMFQDMSGPERKQWVVDKIHKILEQYNVDVSDASIEFLIEQAIQYSKRVNQRDKDK